MKKITYLFIAMAFVTMTLTSCIFGLQNGVVKFDYDPNNVGEVTVTLVNEDIGVSQGGETKIKIKDGKTKSEEASISWVGYDQEKKSKIKIEYEVGGTTYKGKSDKEVTLKAGTEVQTIKLGDLDFTLE